MKPPRVTQSKPTFPGRNPEGSGLPPDLLALFEAVSRASDNDVDPLNAALHHWLHVPGHDYPALSGRCCADRQVRYRGTVRPAARTLLVRSDAGRLWQ